MQVLLRSLAPPAAAPGLDDKLNSGYTECHQHSGGDIWCILTINQ